MDYLVTGSMGKTRCISHSAKGGTWADHKYIRKENGHYIYPGDLPTNKATTGGNVIEDTISEYGDKFNEAAKVLSDTDDTYEAIKQAITDAGIEGVSDKDIKKLSDLIDKVSANGIDSLGVEELLKRLQR